VIDNVGNARKRSISGQLAGRPVVFEHGRVVKLGDQSLSCEVDRAAGGFIVSFLDEGGRALSTHELRSVWKPGQPVWHGAFDDATISVQVRPRLNGFALSHQGVAVDATVYTKREAELAALMPVKVQAGAGKNLLCPMPGLVISIAVTEGQDVKAGEALAVVEAMKMENVLRAERDATVKKVLAKAGDSLAVDAVIMEFA